MRNRTATSAAIPDLFELTWGRAVNGYTIASADLPSASAILLGVEGEAPRLVVRRNGSAMEWYKPATLNPQLHREFAAIPGTAESARDFANKYGLLGLGMQTAEVQEEDAEWILAARDKLRATLLMLDHSSASPASRAGRRPGKSKGTQSLDLAALFNDSANPQCTIRIDTTNPRRPALRVVPRTLYAWMWLRVAQELTGGGQYRQCKLPGCGEWFYVSQDKRRAKQEFCSDLHRVKAWRGQQRKGKKK